MCRSLQNLIITHYRDKNTVQAIVFVEALFLYIILSPKSAMKFFSKGNFRFLLPITLLPSSKDQLSDFPKWDHVSLLAYYFKRGFEKYCSGHIFKQAQVTVVNYLFVLISVIKGTYLNLSRFSVLCESILIYSAITALFWFSKINFKASAQ